LKWLEIFLISDETKRHKCANCHGAASFDEASSICEHDQFRQRCQDIIRFALRLGRAITADLTDASREDHAECISVSGWSLRRHPDMEAVGVLVELQFRIAA
jgi:hypothetical protein